MRYSSFRQGLIIEGGSGNRYLPKLDRRPRRATKDECAEPANRDASRNESDLCPSSALMFRQFFRHGAIGPLPEMLSGLDFYRLAPSDRAN